MNLISLGLLQYTLVVNNAGPSAVSGAVVADTFAASIGNVLWSCVGIGGGACVANGTGNINQLVDLPVGATVVYSITATVALPLPNAISNTATVTAPSGVSDPVLGNNTSTVNDRILLFSDGFEAAGPIQPQTLDSDQTPRRVTLDGALLAGAAIAPVAGELASFRIGEHQVWVQVRRLGERLEVRVLAVDGAGNWQIGAWEVIDAARPLVFEWSARPVSGGGSVLSARAGN